MAKKKNKQPRVRAAKAGDRNLFRKLWMAYLKESYENKDIEIKPTEANLDKYSTLFDLYVNEQMQGVVLFVGEATVLMWGSAGATPFEADHKHRALAWGMYEKPEFRAKGHADLITNEALRLLKGMNFEILILDVKHGGTDKGAKFAESIKAKASTTLYTVEL